jgi:hypothetical protein
MGDHPQVTPSSGGALGTVVVRAWIEEGGAAREIRARVLVVRGSDPVLHEIGAAAGLDAVLSLVTEGLLSVGDPPS